MNNKTHLLPPVTAIKMVWARTGALSSDPHSQILAGQAELAAKEIRERAEGVEHEERYVISAFAALDACYRNLDIIHKKRNQDFQQNEKLRNAYFETVKENLEFGTKAKDFLQSLPSVTIGGAGGLTLAEVLGLSMRPVWSWVFALGLASAGYLFNLLIVRLMRKKKQMLYVLQDYEPGIAGCVAERGHEDLRCQARTTHAKKHHVPDSVRLDLISKGSESRSLRLHGPGQG